MKRYLFKPVVYFAALAAIPAVAQTTDATSKTPAKTPIELFESAADKDRTPVEFDAKKADALDLKLKFAADGIEVVGTNLPLVCAKHLEIRAIPEPIAGAADKLETAESIKTEDLKGYAAKVVVKFVFNGTPEVKDLAECKRLASKLEKADLSGKDRIFAAFDSDAGPAYIEVGSTDVKNTAFLALESTVGRANCTGDCNSTPEKLSEAIAATSKAGLKGLTAALARDKTEEFQNQLVTAIEEATTVAEADLVRKGVSKFLGDLEKTPLSESLNEELKKGFRNAAYVILKEGLVAKAKELCKPTAAAGTAAANSTSAWARATSFYKPVAEKKVSLVSPADECMKLIARSMNDAAAVSGLSTAQKKEDLYLAKEVVKSGSPARTMILSEINALDVEVVSAKNNAIQQIGDGRLKLFTQCGVHPQDPSYTVRLPEALFSTASHYAYNKAECDRLSAATLQQESLATALGLQLRRPAADMMGYEGFNAVYRGNGSALAQNGSYSPFELDRRVFPGATVQQNFSPYQAIDTDGLYRQTQKHPVGAQTQNVNQSRLPVAIPLSMPTA